MKGNFDVLSGGEISVEGPGAEGVLVDANIKGQFDNGGDISVTGTATPQTTKTTNATSGSAVVIEANITQGIVNDGPINTTGVNAAGTAVGFASISTSGGSPALVVAATASDLTIGAVKDATNNDTVTGTGYSLLNRGTHLGGVSQPRREHHGHQPGGRGGNCPTELLRGGIFNSGTISATSTTKTADGFVGRDGDRSQHRQLHQCSEPREFQPGGPRRYLGIRFRRRIGHRGSHRRAGNGHIDRLGLAQAQIDNDQGSTISATAETTDNTNTVLQAALRSATFPARSPQSTMTARFPRR